MTSPELAEIAVRLAVAMSIGAAIGVNRHMHDQPAGLRTHAVVALAAALAVLAVAPLGSDTTASVDAQSRVLQGILTGVGFIGAGVILHAPQGHQIHGLTTAAAIWITAVFGALCGRGHIDIAVLGFALVLIVLLIGAPIEDYARRRFGRPREKGEADSDR